MNNNQTIPFSTEGLRTAAHSLATVLYSSAIGGECYHGGRHTCFVRQGRKPLATYKVADLCERCATAWHAVMAAALLDSIIIGQQFLNKESPGQHVLQPVGASPFAAVPAVPAGPPWPTVMQSPQVTLPNAYSLNALKVAKATSKVTAKPAPKASTAKSTKSLVCKKCHRVFKQSNARTMHERFCSGAKK